MTVTELRVAIQPRTQSTAGSPSGLRALVRALTARYTVTFPTRTTNGVTLVSTHQPEAAMRLFDTAYFSWSQKTQVAVLSAITAPRPPLSAAQVVELLDHQFDWRRLLAEAAIAGLLQPGVDGDFAGLSMFAGGLDDVLAHLQVECQREAVGFRILSEAEFRTTTWILED
jgi:hypothetical protein